MIVPPQAGIEGEIGVEEVGLQEKCLNDEQASERLADDGRFFCRPIAGANGRHQFFADELTEQLRPAHRRQPAPRHVDT
jgi:hypothetical protein